MLNNEDDIKNRTKKARGDFMSRKSLALIEQDFLKLDNLTDADINNDIYLNFLAETMKKNNRNYKENLIIQKHMMKMGNFINMIQESNIDINNMLSTISEKIKYEYAQKENILFKIGDKGDKFYIILKGKVDVIVSNETREKLTEGDYILYLSRLRKYEEYTILNRLIVLNKTIFPIEFDNFDYFVKKSIDMIIEILNIPDFINYTYEEEDIEKIFSSHENKKLTTKSIIHALLSDDIKYIYKITNGLNDYNLISNYLDKVENFSNMNENSPARKKLNKILKSSDSIIKNNIPNKDIDQKIILHNVDNAEKINSIDLDQMKISPFDKNISSEISNNKNNKEKDINICNSDKYVNRYKIQAYDSNPTDKTENLLTFTIIQYNFLLNLSIGCIFGEKALSPSCDKRTATIITSDDCHFGILMKDVYMDCIREVDEKIKKQNKSILLSNVFFNKIDKYTFEKRYFNFFILKRISRNQKLIYEAKSPDAINFIREGEFDISFKTSLNDLSKIIKHLILGGMNKEYSLRKYFFSSLHSQKEILNTLKMHSHEHLYDKFADFFKDLLPFGEIDSDPMLGKYLEEKRLFKISSITKKDIVGFEDYICNDKNIFTVECITQKGSYFSLDYQFLKTIAHVEKITKEFYEKYLNNKKEILIERLIKIRNVYLEKFRKSRAMNKMQISLEANLYKNTLNNPNTTINKNTNLEKIFQSNKNPFDKNKLYSNENKKNYSNIETRLEFIKNLQELHLKNEQGLSSFKATLLPKKSFKKNSKNHEQSERKINIINNNINKNYKYNDHKVNLKCFSDSKINNSKSFFNINFIKKSCEMTNSFNLISTLNDNDNMYSTNGNFFFTNYPIFSVDCSQNLNNQSIMNNNINSISPKANHNPKVYNMVSFVDSEENNNKLKNNELNQTTNENGAKNFIFPDIRIKSKITNNQLFASYNNNIKINKEINLKQSDLLDIKNFSKISNTVYNDTSATENPNIISNKNFNKFNKTNIFTNFDFRSLKNFEINKTNYNNPQSFLLNEDLKISKANIDIFNFENSLCLLNQQENKHRQMVKVSSISDIINSEENKEIMRNDNNSNTRELKMQKCINYANSLESDNKNFGNGRPRKILYDGNKKYMTVKDESMKSSEKIEFIKTKNSSGFENMKSNIFQMNNTKDANKEFYRGLNIASDQNFGSNKNTKFKPKINIELNSSPLNTFSNKSVRKNENTLCKNLNKNIKINFDCNFEIENETQEDQINIFNSTQEFFKKANRVDFMSQKKKDFTKKLLSSKYKINSNNLSKSRIFINKIDDDEYFDEKSICKLIQNKQINIDDINKLSLIPNFNLNYLNKMLTKIEQQQNKFNNLLLDNFKPDLFKSKRIIDKSDNDKIQENAQKTEINNIYVNKISNLKLENMELNAKNDLKSENINQIHLSNKTQNFQETNSNVTPLDINLSVSLNKDKINHLHSQEKEEKPFPDRKDDNLKYLDENLIIQDRKIIINSKEEKDNENLFNDPNYKNLKHTINQNLNIISERLITETMYSDNNFFINNLGSSTFENKKNKNLYLNEDIDKTKVLRSNTIPYKWGTKFSCNNQTKKTFLNLISNLNNTNSLKAHLLPDCIIDQYKLSSKRKENLILTNSQKILTRTQNVFQNYVLKSKKTHEKIQKK